MYGSRDAHAQLQGTAARLHMFQYDLGSVLMWLLRQTEHDADAMGAAISKAAGCSSDAIICGMQRKHVRGMLERQAESPGLAEALDSRETADMAALQHLLPDTQLPSFFVRQQRGVPSCSAGHTQSATKCPGTGCCHCDRLGATAERAAILTAKPHA